MNWEALGSIAELVAVIAVMVTLPFVVLQTREARCQLSINAAQNLVDAFYIRSNWSNTLIV